MNSIAQILVLFLACLFQFVRAESSVTVAYYSGNDCSGKIVAYISSVGTDSCSTFESSNCVGRSFMGDTSGIYSARVFCKPDTTKTFFPSEAKDKTFYYMQVYDNAYSDTTNATQCSGNPTSVIAYPVNECINFDRTSSSQKYSCSSQSIQEISYDNANCEGEGSTNNIDIGCQGNVISSQCGVPENFFDATSSTGGGDNKNPQSSGAQHQSLSSYMFGVGLLSAFALLI